MKKTLPLFNDDIAVDTQKFLDGKLLLQANTGGGKSWATRRIIEQFAGVVPQIILDPEGEFFTLRQKYPDFILIGKGQEIAADPKSAGLLAHKLIEERVSCIIDLLEMKSAERDLFVKNFLQAMINAPRSLWLPTLLTIDEAQIFAPEKGDSETSSTLKDAGFRFRKRHFGLILATPRISELSKSVASTCKNKLIGQASLDNDMKRSAAEIGFTTKEEVMSLRDLDPGEFYAYGPAFSKRVVRLKIGKTTTQHGDSAAVDAKVAKPSPKVQKALAILATVPQAAEKEAKTISGLETELRAAKGQIQALERGLQSPSAPVDNTKAIQKALAGRDAQWRAVLKPWKDAAYMLAGGLEKAQKALEAILKIEWPDSEPTDVVLTHEPGATLNAGNIHSVLAQVRKIEKMPEVEGNGSISKGEMLVLRALASFASEGMTRAHLTIATGYKKSTRDRYINYLQQKMLVRVEGGRVFIEESESGNFEPLPRGEALIEHYLNTLPEGERKIFKVLTDAGGAPVDREAITNETNYQKSTRDRYINYLQTRELVENVGRGLVRAAAQLYEV